MWYRPQPHLEKSLYGGVGVAGPGDDAVEEYLEIAIFLERPPDLGKEPLLEERLEQCRVLVPQEAVHLPRLFKPFMVCLDCLNQFLDTGPPLGIGL